MVVCVLFTGINSSASVFSWATDLAPTKSANRYTHNYYGDWSNTDYSELYYNAGVYTRVEYTGSEVVIETYDGSFKITSSKKIDSMPLNCYMGSYMGATYNFLVYGIDRPSTETSTANTCCVVKYDKYWTELGKYYYQSTARGIGRQDVTDFAENGDILYIEATETRSNGHEFSICLEFDSANNTLTKSAVGEVTSHRMSSYITYDADSLVTVKHSDNSPRGIGIARTRVKWGSKDYGCRSSIYRLPDHGETSANFTGITVGGLMVAQDHYLIAYSCMKEKYKLGEKTDNSSYIQLARVSKDSIDTDLTFATSVTLDPGTELMTFDLDTSASYTICPYIIHWKDDKYVIMWDSGSAQGVNYVIYSDNTQTISDIKTLSDPTLSDVTPLSVNGCIVWYATGGIYENGAYTRIHPLLPSDWNSAPTFYRLNPETGACATEGHIPKIFTYAEMNPTTETTTTSAKTETTDSANEVTTKPETSTETPAANVSSQAVITLTYNNIIYCIEDGTATCTGVVDKTVSKVTIPAAVTYENDRHKKTVKVTAIEKEAFKDCKKLTTVKIGKNVTSIGDNAFKGCSKLTTVTMPSNVTLGKNAFKGCKKLKSCKLTSVTKVKVKNKNGKKIVITWKRVVNTNYEIQYSTSEKFKNKKTVKISSGKVKLNSSGKATKTFKGLTKGKTYYVRIRAYRTAGGKTWKSSWVTKKVKITK